MRSGTKKLSELYFECLISLVEFSLISSFQMCARARAEHSMCKFELILSVEQTSKTHDITFISFVMLD